MRDTLAPPTCPAPAPDDDATIPQCPSRRSADGLDPADRLQGALEQSAARIPHLDRRDGPHLVHKPDGSYEYEGPVFTARIAPDGSVDFRDHASKFVGFGPGTIVFSFDITDAVEHGLMGKPLYPAEKRWFLEQTETFRDQVTRDYRARLFGGAARGLRGKLLAIVGDARLTPADKRARVFALWDDCADDEVGTRAQDIVERFVRENMPEGSALAFEQEELARFNARRASRRAFAPYTQAADAGPAADPG
jgi:hypothetical protein